MSDSDSEKEFQNEGSRRSFLLTYSQANLEKFPNCESFANAIVSAFNDRKSTKSLKEWACCIENHKDSGKHYHMSVNLSGPRRWKPIRDLIYTRHGISVNFSLKTCGYVAAYRYVAKDKNISDVLLSSNHSNMEVIGSPQTKKAMCIYREKSKNKRKSTQTTNGNSSEEGAGPSSKKFKPKRLSNCDVSDFLVKNNIRDENQLMNVALRRSESGEKDLQKFILDRGPKRLSDLISTTWRMQNAPETCQREQKSRFQIIQENAAKDCVAGCGGTWLEMAYEVLRNNKINVHYFACALRTAFKKGRQKNVNILIVGPTNCGKSFLLNPIELVFKTFVNPASSRYAWVGLDECEVAYLNDYRWNAENIAWKDFLLLLEGQTVHLPRPKNIFSNDMRIDRSNTIPFFATSKGIIEYYGKFNARDDRETDMMRSRWQVFEFHYQIPLSEAKVVEPCPRCFSTLVLEGLEFGE